MKKRSLVRVTAVLSYIESAWKEYWFRKVGFEEADKVSKESSEFGTRVHKIVEESLLNDHPIEARTAEEKCALRIFDYLLEHDIKPLFDSYEQSLEVEVKDTKLKLIGHFDMAASWGGVPFIVDFKTSGKMRKSFPLQMAAYAKMANKMFKTKINDGLCLRAHWNKETKEVEFEYKVYNKLITKYWPIYNAGLKVYWYFNRGSK